MAKPISESQSKRIKATNQARLEEKTAEFAAKGKEFKVNQSGDGDWSGVLPQKLYKKFQNSSVKEVPANA